MRRGAGRRRMDQSVGRRHRRARSVADHRAAGAMPGAERGRQALRPARRSMSNSASRADAEPQRRFRHRRAGAAGAELHRPAQRHVRQLPPEALGEAGAIRVVADPLAAAQHHGVHRAQRPASGDSSDSSGTTACLQGWVMFSPSKPIRSAASSSSGNASAPRPSSVRSISR